MKASDWLENQMEACDWLRITVNYAEKVEEHVELVNLPEEVVSLGPDLGMGEDEDGRHRDPEDDASDACN